MKLKNICNSSAECNNISSQINNRKHNTICESVIDSVAVSVPNRKICGNKFAVIKAF